MTYNVTETAWERLAESFISIEKSYVRQAIEANGDLTRFQAETEFWQRLAEYCGLDIHERIKHEGRN